MVSMIHSGEKWGGGEAMLTPSTKAYLQDGHTIPRTWLPILLPGLVQLSELLFTVLKSVSHVCGLKEYKQCPYFIEI